MEFSDIEALLDDLERHLKGNDGKNLPNGQRAVLYACLKYPSLTYQNMPEKLRTESYGSFSWRTLKNDAHLIFGRLSRAFQEDIKKKNCRRKLIDWYNQRRNCASPSTVPTDPSFEVSMPQRGLRLSAWEHGLAALTAAIDRGQKIIGISGLTGSGKTYLTYALIEILKPNFDIVIQCQASDVPSINHLYGYVVDQRTVEKRDGSAITALFDLLHTRPVLLVIDQTESLFQAQALAGQFKADSMGYESWLNRLLSSPSHQGCLIWVGRELPGCFDFRYSILYQHKMSRLQSEDAAILLSDRHILVDTIPGWEKLVDFCGGNPAWLLMEASLLQGARSQDMLRFLADPALSQNVIDMVERSLKRLSDIEQNILVWLLLKPVSYKQLRQIGAPGFLPHDLELALRSLEKRDVVRCDERYLYRVNAPLLEHVIAQYVVKQIDEELSSNRLRWLGQFPLFHGAAAAGRQNWQHQHVLRLLGDRFRNHYGFRQEQITRIRELLGDVRHLPNPQRSYAVSNLLNLAITLHLPLAEFEISGLQICHVDLRQANLSHANLESCTFQETLLPLNLKEPLKAHIAPDGRAIALGDSVGHILYWQRKGTSLRLQAFHKLSTPIEQVRFQDANTLLWISQNRLYSWWIDGEATPKKIIDLDAPVSCLAHSNVGHIAVGLIDGRIILWKEIGQWRRVLNAHTSAICNLSFSPDGRSLASIGYGNRVLVWDLVAEPDAPLSCREVLSGSHICAASGWNKDGQLLRVDVNDSRICVRTETAVLHDVSVPGGHIIAVNFSQNGEVLIGSNDAGVIFCWQRTTEALSFLKNPSAFPIPLGMCDESRWLLAQAENSLMVYDWCRQELVWQASVSAFECAPFNMKYVQRLTPAEHDLMRSLGADISE